MKKLIIYIMLIFTLPLPELMAQDFTAQVRKNRIALGERFEIAFVVKGGGENFMPPDFTDFRILGGPNTSSSIQIINGNYSRSKTFSYILMPEKAGELTIAPASIEIDGNRVESNPVKITVIKGSAGQKGNNQGRDEAGAPADKLFIRAIISNDDPYRGEQITVTYKLYTRVSVVSYAVDEMPQLNGFWSQDLEVPRDLQIQNETVDGVQYKTAVIRKVALFPQKSGKLEVDPLSMDLVIRVRDQRRRRGRDPFFDDFFNFGYREIKQRIKSPPVRINVKALPANAPASFSGAVGKFELSSSLNPAETASNEPVTLKITVSGRGNIKLIQAPDPDLPPGFEVYDPKIHENIRTSGNIITGSRTFEYLLIPRQPGNYKLAPLPFTYFDPVSQEYIHQETPSYNLNVTRGKTGDYLATPNVGKEDVELIGEDIRYIESDPGNLMKQDEQFYLSVPYLALTVTPFLLFFGMVFYRRRNKQLQQDTVLLKRRRASAMVRKQLRQANKYRKDNQPEAFFTELNNAIWTYLSNKLDIQKADLTKDKATEALQGAGVPANETGQLMEIVDACEQARYAPSLAHTSMDQLYEDAEKLLSSIERNIGK